MTAEKDQEFMSALHMYIAYWNGQELSCKEKLEGLCHSILVILDGMSGSFDGDISDLVDGNRMLHDNFYRKKEGNHSINIIEAVHSYVDAITQRDNRSDFHQDLCEDPVCKCKEKR